MKNAEATFGSNNRLCDTGETSEECSTAKRSLRKFSKSAAHLETKYGSSDCRCYGTAEVEPCARGGDPLEEQNGLNVAARVAAMNLTFNKEKPMKSTP